MIVTGTQGDGGNQNAQCCAQVVTAIATVTAQLAAIANTLVNLPSGTSPPIDLTTVVVQLRAIVSVIAEIKTTPPIDWTIVDADLKAIAKAIAEGTIDPNVKRIADQLDGITDEWQGSDELLKAMADAGAFLPALAQLLTS